jgi:hypothetical protein
MTIRFSQDNIIDCVTLDTDSGIYVYPAIRYDENDSYIEEVDFTAPMAYRILFPSTPDREIGYASIAIGYGSYSDNYSKKGRLSIDQEMNLVELGFDNSKGEFQVVPYIDSNRLLDFILTGNISVSIAEDCVGI